MSSCIVDANGNYYLLIDNNLYIVHDSNRDRSDPVWLESDVKQIAANEFGFFSLINTELYVEVGRRRKLFRSNVLNFGTTNSGLFIITVEHDLYFYVPELYPRFKQNKIDPIFVAADVVRAEFDNHCLFYVKQNGSLFKHEAHPIINQLGQRRPEFETVPYTSTLQIRNGVSGLYVLKSYLILTGFDNEIYIYHTRSEGDNLELVYTLRYSDENSIFKLIPHYGGDSFSLIDSNFKLWSYHADFMEATLVGTGIVDISVDGKIIISGNF